MNPEITIKISFAPEPAGVIKPTVEILDISPPELPEGTSVEEVPLPPELQEESLSSFNDEVPPPPAPTSVEYDVPSILDTESAENASKEIIEPLQSPTEVKATKKAVK